MASTTKALALFSVATLLSANRVARGPIVGNPGGETISTPTPVSKADEYATDANRSAKEFAGAVPPSLPAADVKFSSKNSVRQDLRARIKVPTEYITGLTSGYGNVLKDAGGIIFPYTPQISFEHKAEYSSQTPLHSNYILNFYRNSGISDIGIQAVFTVQNDKDAITYLATVHLLRALTKMRFGADDPAHKGAPPPVCRLYAYGDFMLDKTPVVISSFKVDLPVDVDYYYLGPDANPSTFGEAFVPTKSTFNITCKPMYSRNEMLNATVKDWLNPKNTQRKTGLL